MKQLLAVLYTIPYFLLLATDSFAKRRMSNIDMPPGVLYVDTSSWMETFDGLCGGDFFLKVFISLLILWAITTAYAIVILSGITSVFTKLFLS